MYNIYVDGVFIESFITEEEAKAYSATMLVEVRQHQYDKLEAWPFPTNYESWPFPTNYEMLPTIDEISRVQHSQLDLFPFPTSPKP